VRPSLGGFEAANQECDDLTKQIQTSETNIRILASQLEQEQAKFEDLCQALYKKQK
jgi:chaperonin cofactor prefoldin